MPEELKNPEGEVKLTLEERRQKFVEEYQVLTKKYNLVIVPDKVTLAIEDTSNAEDN